MNCKECFHEDRTTCPTTAIRSMMEAEIDWPCAFARRRTHGENIYRMQLRMELSDIEYRPNKVDDRKSHTRISDRVIRG